MVVIAGIIGGLMVAMLGTALGVLLLGAQFPWIGPATFFALWVGSIAVALRSASAALAWRRFLFAAAIVCIGFVAASLLAPGMQALDRVLAPIALLAAGAFALAGLATRARAPLSELG